MELIALFKKILQAKSETPDDGGLLDFVSGYLPGFTSVRLDTNGVKNLFIYKKFGEGEHLCFAGHVDVVPAGEGWSFDPYAATEQEGYIYGRGAQDMKSGFTAFLQAVKETEHFNGTLSLLLTSDEEGPAKHGTLEVLKYLEKEAMIPDACIVAEPTCEEVFGDAIKIGRRGSINGVIEKHGKQGHAAYRQSGLGDQGQIFRLKDESVYVYWDTAALNPSNTPEDNYTYPFTTKEYDATTRLRCKAAGDSEFGNCPAGVLRMDDGQGSVVIQNQLGEIFTINFMKEYVNATNRQVKARLEGDNWVVTVENGEVYEVPLGLIQGG